MAQPAGNQLGPGQGQEVQWYRSEKRSPRFSRWAYMVSGAQIRDLRLRLGWTRRHLASERGAEIPCLPVSSDRPFRSGRSKDWIKVKNPDASAAIRVIEG